MKDIINIIKDDHKKVERLFTLFMNNMTNYYNNIKNNNNKNITDDNNNLKSKGDEIIKLLSIHSFCEEQTLYPAMRKANMGDWVDKSLTEHQKLKTTLYELDQLPFGNEYLKKMEDVIKETTEHVAYEEKESLPHFQSLVTGEALVTLGEEFEGQKYIAPTRPHPSAPTQPPLSTVAGGIVSSFDKLKDTIQNRDSKKVHAGKEPEQNAPGLENKMRTKPDYGLDSYVGSKKLLDKVAIVTGGDSGIGRAVCLAFAREGCRGIVISYLKEEQQDAEETKAVCEADGAKCVLYPGNFCDDGVCKMILKSAVDAFGKIDILVNNAAMQGKAVSSFLNIPFDRVEKTFKVNIIAPFALTQYCIPHMNEGGSIINVSSIQAYDPNHSILDYACTKGAMVSFTKGLARDPILCQRGIRVNCVAPGPVWTPLIPQSFNSIDPTEFGKKYPLGRPAQPAELAPSFVFLASNCCSSFINGEVLGVTGGGLLA